MLSYMIDLDGLTLETKSTFVVYCVYTFIFLRMARMPLYLETFLHKSLNFSQCN
jgi:hypothetical protein